MGKLNTDDHVRIDAANEVDDATQRLFVRPAPQAKAGRRNAPFGADMRRLDHQKTESGRGKAAKMHEMPVLGDSPDCAVLAHR